jgi:hypothetical protein
VACFSTEPQGRLEGDAGFATPAATVVSLGLAIIAMAVTLRSAMELRLARADRDRTVADYALAGAQQAAALAVIGARQGAPLRWEIATDIGPAVALAEPQAGKLAPEAAAVQAPVLARLGVSDAAVAQARLRALVPGKSSDFDVEAIDSGPVWTGCARSMISPYGLAVRDADRRPVAPIWGPLSWRIGEAWRLRVRAAGGWVDDRVVRFTGDATHPAAVVERRLQRTGEGEDACDRVLAGDPTP